MSEETKNTTTTAENPFISMHSKQKNQDIEKSFLDYCTTKNIGQDVSVDIKNIYKLVSQYTHG
ncbi:hypothetical protein JZM24_09110 [Candidatus Sodalis endolongispinus]|uniref:Uncharacterized protein n=1 Tax=Candidatus Sodalis endolongispinus TaxID=2812662 RepID=A0ABS5YC15_9GAMM|nr:hypothetical protein [Candidatus Sodalis endolongispinus]MBT9432242.1 hypothetical protein [Candidatus Sodalis endolongispinus]